MFTAFNIFSKYLLIVFRERKLETESIRKTEEIKLKLEVNALKTLK